MQRNFFLSILNYLWQKFKRISWKSFEKMHLLAIKNWKIVEKYKNDSWPWQWPSLDFEKFLTTLGPTRKMEFLIKNMRKAWEKFSKKVEQHLLLYHSAKQQKNGRFFPIKYKLIYVTFYWIQIFDKNA